MSFTSVQEATKLIMESISVSLKTETKNLEELVGCTLAEQINADRDYPPYDRCMMDGICLPSSHQNSQYTIAGTIHAGSPTSTALESNEVWRINTGAPIPAECDIIIPVEELEISGDQVTTSSTFQRTPGKFIHLAGSDVKKGDCILTAGQSLNAANLSIAASVGALKLQVITKPKVFILTTGQEAIPPSDTPTPYQIRQSHPTALHTALLQLGITEMQFSHLSDNLPEMTESITAAMEEYDVIITTGAISKGTSDYLGQIFRNLKGAPLFHGVSQRPGKPMAYWPADESTPVVFALPGNAISTLVTFHRYVAPALQKIMGLTPTEPATISVEHGLPDFHLTRFLPVKRISLTQATLLNPQNSGDFSQLSNTDGFMEVPLGSSPESPSPLHYYPWL